MYVEIPNAMCLCACENNGENDVVTTAMDLMCMGCVVRVVIPGGGRLEDRD